MGWSRQWYLPRARGLYARRGKYRRWQDRWKYPGYDQRKQSSTVVPVPHILPIVVLSLGTLMRWPVDPCSSIRMGESLKG